MRQSEKSVQAPLCVARGLKALALAMICASAVLVTGLVRGQTPRTPVETGVLTPFAPAGFVGSSACAQCHAPQTKAWLSSQHARAMQAATPQNILGDFNDSTARHFGSRARFFQKGAKYIVETEGKDGKTAEFVIDYTFGLAPLQQYLTSIGEGRLQALPYAWDTRDTESGGQRWIHLYPDDPVPPGDGLHWTGAQQNWNFMCADCHSTGVRKTYDSATNTYATIYSEISAGCESCHGAASGHVSWARGGAPSDGGLKGFASMPAKRPTPDWTPDPATGSPAHGVTRPQGDEVETCGTCHARRAQFGEGWQPGKSLMDFYRPTLLTPDLFEADGQMRDEVFNYASFQQSKMHAKGLVCSDCHEPHSGKLKAEGSEVCAQCHLPEKFKAPSHTGHASAKGPDCIACHMPTRTYMVVDQRHDHSFRIPRPDLSVTLGTPNACTDCHKDKSAAWAAQAVTQWHGPLRKGFQTYAPAFHAAATDALDARELLLQVARDAQTPALARATALSFLQSRPSLKTMETMAAGLRDEDAMVRLAALEGLASQPLTQRWQAAASLLSDPIRAVRLQAVALLAEGPPQNASPAERAAFTSAAQSYVAAQKQNADRPEGRANLGRFYWRQGKTGEAEQEYLAALKLGFSITPRIELADLYRALGREADCELLLRQTISIAPQAAVAHHALGLALIRTKRLEPALAQLARAVELEPAQARYAYVYAVALEGAGRSADARSVLENALAAQPSNIELLSALLQNALRAKETRQALTIAERLRILLPDDPSIARLAAEIGTSLEKSAPK